MNSRAMANEPVLIVMDGKYLVHAGQPETFNKKLLADYAKKGYKIQTVTIEKYRAKTWLWIYDKAKKADQRYE